MITAELKRLIEEVKALSLEQRRQLRQMIDSLPAMPTEEDLDRRMRDSGFIHLGSRGPREANPQPVRVEGKPLSESLLEERR